MPSMFTLFFLILYSSLCPPSFLIATCVRLPCSPPSSVVPSLLKVETPPPRSLEFQLRGFKVSGSVVGGVGRVGGGHQTCRVLQASEDSQGPLLKGAGQLTNP